MAKQRFQGTRFMAGTRLALFAALILATGLALGGASQQSASTSVPGNKAAGAPGQRSTRTSAQRRTKAAGSIRTESAEGKRDPFKLPGASAVRTAMETTLETAPEGGLPSGKRGLLISQVKLEGVVREQTGNNKMIALVVSTTDPRKLAYFLYENDAVYNGVVSRITPDAVYFKENVLDPSGRVATREVVARLGSVPGEAR
jgi:hypothetical protein